MTEKQADKIIELLEGVNDKLRNIESNTDKISDLTSDVWDLDCSLIKKLLQDNF